ncbi:hypothetical protein A5784_17245 [Mycobacterium sp. 852013-50091_SCH5140682]|uniref:TetR/AcrR family transcriptional regulator n=1 Tax=Mycobacterium sp. 852013-50091_SCH5140682 TaxID=1834109 RepID=UPI0007EC2B77|nr:TetR/AcrR family transcriptional regulator [Mycobacterium sp. 852013-50091_SCH5140682]OBC01842.1 hypothetical protein A5784_17245 [Mycobacterium sp. 852013-50091_SCH5140682]
MVGVRRFDEQVVLDQALAVFAELGYRSATMGDLASATGVQRGSLYNAYGAKDEIFLRVFGAYATRFLDGAARALDEADPASALGSFFEYCIDAITRAGVQGCLSTRTAIEAAADSSRVAGAVRTMLDDLGQIVCAALERLDSGLGSLRVDPRAAARLVVTTTRGLAVMERAGYTAEELRQIAGDLVTSLVVTGNPTQ